jgi:hypothetical protein
MGTLWQVQPGSMKKVAVTLSDPDDLTDEDYARLNRLQQMPEADFDTEVTRYVLDPTESDQFIFRHPELAELTALSLQRLVGRTQAARGKARDRDRRVWLDRLERALSIERKTIKPYVNQAMAQATRGSDREVAEKVLGRVLYPLLKAVMRDLKRGSSAGEVEAALKAHPAVRDLLAALSAKSRKG